MGIGREELLSGEREWIYIQCTERDFILLNGYTEQVMGSTGGGVDVSLCLWMCLSRESIIGIRTIYLCVRFYLLVWLFNYLCIQFFICLFTYLCIYLCKQKVLFMYLFIYIFMCWFVYLLVYLVINLCIVYFVDSFEYLFLVIFLVRWGWCRSTDRTGWLNSSWVALLVWVRLLLVRVMFLLPRVDTGFLRELGLAM